MAQIEKRGDTYRIRVSLGVDYKGNRISKSTTYKPKAKSEKAIEKEVQKFAFQYENEVLNGLHNADNITFYDFSKEWLNDHIKIHLSASEYERYSWELEKRVYGYIGHLKLSCITVRDIQKIINDMEKNGYSPSTIAKTKTVMSSCFSYAYKQELIQSNPCTRLILPKVQKDNELHCFNYEQTITFLNALRLEYPNEYKEHISHNRITHKEQSIKAYTTYSTIPLQFQLYFTLAIMSGLRKSEELALTWNDIDYDQNTININKATTRTKEKGQFLKDTKTISSEREISVPTCVITLFKSWYKEQKEQCEKFGSKWLGYRGKEYDKNFVFIQDNGKQMGIETPLNKFKKIITRFNSLIDSKASVIENENERENLLSKKLPMITLHELRHTHATLLLSENTDIEVVSKRLGHSNASVTLNIYGHALKEKDKTASDKLDDLFKNRLVSIDV